MAITTNSRRDRIVKNVKTGSDIVSYIGSAGLMIPLIHKSREQQNGLMGACSGAAGALISIGLGSFASKVARNIIDKVIDFYDDVKPKKKENPEEEEEENG